MHKSWREESKKDWGHQDVACNLDQVKAGALLRIADAIEKMAVSWGALREERDRYERWYREMLAEVDHKRRRINALRGVITRNKRRRS